MSRTSKWLCLLAVVAAGLLVAAQWLADGRALGAEYRRLALEGRKVQGTIVRYERVAKPMNRDGVGWRPWQSSDTLPVERAFVTIEFADDDGTQRVSEAWLPPFDESLKEGSLLSGYMLETNRRVKAASVQDPFIRRALDSKQASR